MRSPFPVLKPTWYQLAAWYAYSQRKKFQLLSIHRRGGKDVCHFSMTVADAIQFGGIYYYLFPTREWAKRAIWEGQFRVGGEMKPFIEWCIPKGVQYKTNEKDYSIWFPHNNALIKLGGTDDLSFVGQGGAGYTLSEFSIHKPDVTGFIMPILRQAGSPLRMNGTLRGRDNQLWKMLESNMNNPDWFVQWLKPEHTKCYCWVGGKHNINPELMSRIGEIAPNGTPIFNVQDDIDSGTISNALALQEYLNEPVLASDMGYFSNEHEVAKGEGRINAAYVKYDKSKPVFTFWDLGKGTAAKSTDSMVCWFVQFPNDDFPSPKKAHLIDYDETRGLDWAEHARILNTKGYWYGGHYAPWDIATGKAGFAKTSQQYAKERGIDFIQVPRTPSVQSDLEAARRFWVGCHFGEKVNSAVDLLASHHEKTNRDGVSLGVPEHDVSSNAVGGFRSLVRASELGIINPNRMSGPKRDETWGGRVNVNTETRPVLGGKVGMDARQQGMRIAQGGWKR